MAFKTAAQRGAYFEKQKQQGMTPSMKSSTKKFNTLPEIGKLPNVPGLKPIGSFEKLKRSIKMPKVGN